MPDVNINIYVMELYS